MYIVKKLVSNLLVLAMIFSIGISAMAFSFTNAVYYHKNFSAGNGSTYDNNYAGSMGKAASDVVGHITNVTKSGRIYMDLPFNGPAVEKDGTINYKYLVAKVNVKPNLATNMQFLDENGTYIAMPITDTNLTVGKWTSILMYIDYTTITKDNYFNASAADKATVFPKTTIYINGNKYYDFQVSALKNRIGLYAAESDTSHKKRIMLNFGSIPNDTEVADIQIYMTNEDPSTTAAAETARPAFINNDVLTLVGRNNLVNLANGATTAAITAAMNEADNTAIYNVIAYNGTSAIADDTELEAGNTLALEKTVTTKPDGRYVTTKNYAYYTVNTVAAPPAAPSVTMNDGALATGYVAGNSSTITSANGLMGKDTSDAVMKFSQTGKHTVTGYEGITKEGRLFSATTDFVAFEKDGTKKYDYFVMDFDILPKNDVGINFMSSAYMVAPVASDYLHQGQWNKVRIVIDYSHITDPYNTITPDDKTDTFPVGNVYINGKQYDKEGAVDYMCNTLAQRFGMYESDVATTPTTTFRFEITSTTSTDLEAYVDNLHAELTNTTPERAAATALPTLTSNHEDVYLLDNLIIGKGLNTLTNDMISSSSTLSYALADGSTSATSIDDATYVYVKPSEGLFNTYKVSKFNAVKNDGVINVSATNAPSGSCLIVAEYDGAMLAGVKICEDIDTYTMKNASNEVKVMYLDRLTNIKPLVKSIEIK